MTGSQSSPTWTVEASFPSVCGQGRELIESILAEMERLGWNSKDVFAVNMALEESFTNAIEHGNHCDPRKKFHITCRLSEETVYVQVRDEGRGFLRDRIPNPLHEANLETPSGRGILLIHGFMNKVWYNETGNTIYMEKHRTQERVA